VKRHFRGLLYNSSDEMIFGIAKNPIFMKNGMVIGGGEVYPEINFTLPPMSINKDTMPEVIDQYKEMINGVCKRAIDLFANEIVVEVELLPDMTVNSQWGIEVCKIVRDIMYEYEDKYQLKSVMRITPNDIRDMIRPPRMRTGKYVDEMFKTFGGCASER
jgi:methanol--5-hydroxybenzimidazolylcobamide Co-methyltransferase